MKRVAIIGAGQSGLQLGIGLLGAGYQVSIYSDRDAQSISSGRVMSSQCLFHSALETEQSLALNFWQEECPKIEGMRFAVSDLMGCKTIDWSARLDGFAQSVDQRLKLPRWMDEFQKRGGDLHVKSVKMDDLENCARDYDLVLVASGRDSMEGLFARDVSRSPFDRPQRVLALTYVRNAEPLSQNLQISFNFVPNVGEFLSFPALTTTGDCKIMVFEGVPGGPMDCWVDVRTPKEHLARSKEIIKRFFPHEAERFCNYELTDELGTLVGGLTPVVRNPVGTLPTGRSVLGMADAVVLNDPITGQGANNAVRCAEIYLESILELEMALRMPRGCNAPLIVTGKAMRGG